MRRPLPLELPQPKEVRMKVQTKVCPAGAAEKIKACFGRLPHYRSLNSEPESSSIEITPERICSCPSSQRGFFRFFFSCNPSSVFSYKILVKIRGNETGKGRRCSGFRESTELNVCSHQETGGGGPLCLHSRWFVWDEEASSAIMLDPLSITGCPAFNLEETD